MSFILIIMSGLALGFLSQFLTKRRDPGAFITRMIAGLIGAIAGVVISSAFGLGSSSAMLFEIVLIIVLLALYHIIFGKRNAS